MRDAKVEMMRQMAAQCFSMLPHRDRHQCDCVCVLAKGHPGRHRCSYLEAQRLATARKP